VRQGGLVGAVMGAERKALLDRVQGTMGLVEGHAEWAMDRAGGEVLDDVDALRAAMDRRREDRAPLLRILDRLLGFDLKLKQYAQGRVFCDTVVAARGDAGLLAAWAAPELAPTAAELAAPTAWLARTEPAAA
jgi:putative hydrolase